MSWREHAADAQDVMLDTFAERDGDDLFTTEVDDGSGPLEVRAIFEDGWLEVLGTNLVPTSTREIRADVAVSELPSYPLPLNGRSTFTIRRPREGDPRDTSAAVTLRITDQQPDGQGLVRLILQAPRP